MLIYKEFSLSYSLLSQIYVKCIVSKAAILSKMTILVAYKIMYIG
jgi:hypothetical protein